MDNKDAQNQKKKRVQKVPRKITRDRLRNIALHHLQRYATSAANLHRVLERRVIKASRHHDTDMNQAKEWISEIITGLARSGAIDDTKFAEGKSISMLRRGQSPSKVRAYLASKGIGQDTISEALAAAKHVLGDPDGLAAEAYAKRRRFGPYRTREATQDVKEKELAAMGRAGFRYDVARKIIESGDDPGFD